MKSYVKARMLTHDAAQAAAYDADPKIARSIAVNMLLDLHDTSARLVADAATIQVPTLVLNAGADWVVKPAVAAPVFARLSSPVKRLQTFAGMYHDLLHEGRRGEVLAEIRGFAKAAFAREHPANRGLRAGSDGGGACTVEPATGVVVAAAAEFCAAADFDENAGKAE